MPTPPIALAISASAGRYGCVLQRDDGTRQTTDCPDGLAEGVATLFAQAGLPPRACQAMHVDIGPGSYTGLRVATTFARTLHRFGRVAVYTATSLELLALHAWSVERARGPVRVLLDARRGCAHHARVELRQHVVLVEKPRATPLEECAAAMRDDETVLAEESLEPTLRGVVEERVVGWVTARAEPAQRAALLLDPRIATTPASAQALQPLYLMASYAD